MSRQSAIGFSQRIQRPWMDAIASMSAENVSLDDAKKKLDNRLSDKVSVSTTAGRSNRDKSLTILGRVWYSGPDSHPKLLEHARQLYVQVPDDEQFGLHWAMTVATYPFVGKVAAIIGNLLMLQDSISHGEVQKRIQNELGERQTVSRATQRLIRTFVDWEVLSDTGTKGVYAPSKCFRINRSAVIGLLVTGLLIAKGERLLPLQAVSQSAMLFPFQLSGDLGHATRETPTLSLQTLGNGSYAELR